ncbi:MAG: hypothetical protein MZV64_72345 [Ignavibacteriales bacterium]|nr:hypothetical protein [Ignavibacteriales bacterium]
MLVAHPRQLPARAVDHLGGAALAGKEGGRQRLRAAPQRRGGGDRDQQGHGEDGGGGPAAGLAAGEALGDQQGREVRRHRAEPWMPSTSTRRATASSAKRSSRSSERAIAPSVTQIGSRNTTGGTLQPVATQVLTKSSAPTPSPSAGPASTVRAARRSAGSRAVEALCAMFTASSPRPRTSVATDTCESTAGRARRVVVEDPERQRLQQHQAVEDGGHELRPACQGPAPIRPQEREVPDRRLQHRDPDEADLRPEPMAEEAVHHQHAEGRAHGRAHREERERRRIGRLERGHDAAERDQQEAADQERPEQVHGVAPGEGEDGRDDVEGVAARAAQRIANRRAGVALGDQGVRLGPVRNGSPVHRDEPVLGAEPRQLGVGRCDREEARADVAVREEDETGEGTADHRGQLDDGQRRGAQRRQQDRDPTMPRTTRSRAGTSRPSALPREPRERIDSFPPLQPSQSRCRPGAGAAGSWGG